MSFLAKISSFLAHSRSSNPDSLTRGIEMNATRSAPRSSNHILRLPDEILWKVFSFHNSAELHASELTCKSFQSMTRNDALQNNQFWRYILLRHTKPIPDSNLNFKSLYCLFLVNCYVMDKPGLLTESSADWEYNSFHRKKNTRCKGYSCITKERALFKTILATPGTTKEEVLKTVFAIATIFPLRTLWDKQGSEARYCNDCRIYVWQGHGKGCTDKTKPNEVRCLSESFSYEPRDSLSDRSGGKIPGI